MRIFKENIYFFSTTGESAYRIICDRTDNIDEKSHGSDVFGLLCTDRKEKEFLLGHIENEPETFLVASCAKGKRALLVFCPKGCPGMALDFIGVRQESIASLFGTGKYGKCEFSPSMERLQSKVSGVDIAEADEVEYLDYLMSLLSLITHTPSVRCEDAVRMIINSFESAGKFVGCFVRQAPDITTYMPDGNFLKYEDRDIIFNGKFCVSSILCMCALARNYSSDRILNFSVEHDGKGISVDMYLELLPIHYAYEAMSYLAESAARENMVFEYMFEGQTLKIHTNPCYADIGLMGVKA